MSDWLREALASACVSHGVSAETDGARVRIQDGLVIEPHVFEREKPAGTAQVQVDFAIESPHLDGLPFLESFAGVGAAAAEAQQDALSKFLRGSFHVILESLTAHSCVDAQVEWEDWDGESGAWRVCSGPLLMIATRQGARIDGYPEFFAQLNDLFVTRFAAGPHWMRVFVGAIDGGLVGSEVLVDGVVWTDGQRLLDTHAWTYPPGYASLRHLLIALPKNA